MIGATVIAAITFVLGNYIIPPTNIDRINYTNKYVKNKKIDAGTNIQLMVQPGVVAYMARYDASSKLGYRFSLERFEGKTLVSRMTAQSISYDTLYNWKARDYMIRDFDGMKETIRRGSTIDTIIPIEPRDFLISKNDQETLTTPELSQYIEKQKMRGVANIKAFEIEKEKRDTARADARKSQIGSGDRSEKIRTYNYPQRRCTDHRIGLSLYCLEDVLNGDLDNVITPLTEADIAAKLAAATAES
jgi:lipopolysaccharide export system permease protein